MPSGVSGVDAGHRVVLVDVPGQPGLSSGERGLSGGRPSWYGAWLSVVIEQARAGPVVVMGRSFGAALALSCSSSRVERLVLTSPGGLTKLRLTPGALAASAAWFLRPAPAHSARLLSALHGPGHRPRPALVEWMTPHARTTRRWKAPVPTD